MSISQYFSVENTDIGRPAEKITLPSREEAGVSSTEYDNIVAEVEIVPNKRRRTTYHERDKVKIAKYANTYGVASAIKFFQRDFPKLTESTVRPWLKKYRAGLQKSSSGALPVIRTLRLANTNNERRMSDARDLGRGVVRVRVRFVLSLSVVRQLTTTGFEEFHVLIRT